MIATLRKYHWGFFIAAIALIIALGVFLHRSVYLSYDYGYIQDLYNHSQWMLPTSIRGIDDATLYQVAGYELTAEQSFYTINPETPPLGKYFFGWSIQLFGNPFIILIPLFTFSIFLYFLIACMIFTRTWPAQLATVFFVLQPLILGTVGETLLDLPQLIGMLIYLLGLILIVKAPPSSQIPVPILSNMLGGRLFSNNRLRALLGIAIAGVGLGWFVSVKIGFFAVALIVAAAFLLWKQNRLVLLIPLGIIVGLFYVAVYTPYFLQGNSILDFLRAQKWMLDFYLSSPVQPIYGMVFPMLFLGLNKGWWDTAVWSHVEQWTVFWPMFGVAPILAYRKSRYLEPIEPVLRSFLFVLTVALIACLAVVPLFARYFTLLFPVLIIFFTAITIHLRTRYLIIILVLMILHTMLFLSPKVWQAEEAIESHLQNSTYKELYNYLDVQTQREISRDDFWRLLITFEDEIGMKEKTVVLDPGYVWPWQNRAEAELEIVYQTELGELRSKHILPLVRNRNSWSIDWDYNLILDGFSPDAKVVANKETGSYGRQIAPDGTILSEGSEWPYFLVITDQVEDDRTLQEVLSATTGIPDHDIEFAYRANSIPDHPEEIGFMRRSLPRETSESIDDIPGVVVENRRTRVYNQEALSDEQIEWLEEKAINSAHITKPETGGTLTLTTADGKTRTLLEKAVIDGEDYIVDDFTW